VPYIHEHGREKRLIGKAAEAVIDAEPAIEIVGKRPKAGNGEQTPSRAHGNRRDHQRKRVNRAEQSFQWKVAHEQLRQEIAEHELADDGEEREAQR
jgi:hypothetical protein